MLWKGRCNGRNNHHEPDLLLVPKTCDPGCFLVEHEWEGLNFIMKVMEETPSVAAVPTKASIKVRQVKAGQPNRHSLLNERSFSIIRDAICYLGRQGVIRKRNLE